MPIHADGSLYGSFFGQFMMFHFHQSLFETMRTIASLAKEVIYSRLTVMLLIKKLVVFAGSFHQSINKLLGMIGTNQGKVFPKNQMITKFYNEQKSLNRKSHRG